MEKVTLVLVLVSCFGWSLQRPEYPSYIGETTCYNQICPSGTTNCKKHVETSHDKKYVDVTVTCLNDYNGSMKDYYFQETNPRDPFTFYARTSYSVVDQAKTNRPSNNYLWGN